MWYVTHIDGERIMAQYPPWRRSWINVVLILPTVAQSHFKNTFKSWIWNNPANSWVAAMESIRKKEYPSRHCWRNTLKNTIGRTVIGEMLWRVVIHMVKVNHCSHGTSLNKQATWVVYTELVANFWKTHGPTCGWFIWGGYIMFHDVTGLWWQILLIIHVVDLGCLRKPKWKETFSSVWTKKIPVGFAMKVLLVLTVCFHPI